ncbi:MAG: DUF350 domain-containing protein [uncultured Thiotrichaceae bacterium]|uniref:DUF350 domain-containing protein n=1 Tax=uncultured Thiotrichaceae bacterium TaxID=298394 RepID=A0A6S6S1Z4_9GAMM|nr:MAG: DUF350 domain-containing protein [uncultured Thiotrichaceae bacterium]
MDDLKLNTILSTLIYGVLGIILFFLTLWLMEKFTPFSIEKKITEENNVALGIVMGSIILALGMIYAAVID